MRLRLYENYRFVLYAPFYAAHEMGAYAAEGLAVELLPSPGAGLAERALLDGAVEVLWAGPMRVMKHHDDNPGSALVCFAEVVCRDPFSIVGQYPIRVFGSPTFPKCPLPSSARCPHPGCACRRICGRQASTRRRYAEMAETISSVFPALDRAVLVAVLACY